MNTFARHLTEPLSSITEQPYQFAVWWVVAIIFGLAGFWLPIFVSWTGDTGWHAVFITSVKAGSLASFSVVLLAEGIAAALVAVRAGTNLVAAGLRGLVSVFALLVFVIQVSLLVALGSTRSMTSHMTMAAIAILFASYLYCFRFASWEKGLEAVRAKDDETVQELAQSAKQTTSDDSGVLL